jgi:hypothetical protein
MSVQPTKRFEAGAATASTRTQCHGRRQSIPMTGNTPIRCLPGKCRENLSDRNTAYERLRAGEMDPRPGFSHSQPGRLRQVLLNLAANAIEFTVKVRSQSVFRQPVRKLAVGVAQRRIRRETRRQLLTVNVGALVWMRQCQRPPAAYKTVPLASLPRSGAPRARLRSTHRSAPEACQELRRRGR